MPCVLSGNPTRTLDISPEMQGSKSLLMDREFFKVGEAPVRAAIMLHLRIGSIWVYQMDMWKENPTKVHLNEEPKNTLRENTFSGMRTKIHESEPLIRGRGYSEHSRPLALRLPSLLPPVDHA